MAGMYDRAQVRSARTRPQSHTPARTRAHAHAHARTRTHAQAGIGPCELSTRTRADARTRPRSTTRAHNAQGGSSFADRRPTYTLAADSAERGRKLLKDCSAIEVKALLAQEFGLQPEPLANFEAMKGSALLYFDDQVRLSLSRESLACTRAPVLRPGPPLPSPRT